MFDYIAQTSSVSDFVVSGGDSFSLEPPQLCAIGEQLLEIDNVRRIRFASKGCWFVRRGPWTARMNGRRR